VKTPRGYLSIDGLSTDGSGKATFIIAKAKIENYQRRGPKHKFLELHNVKETLESPIVIFEGLKREDFLNSYCFCKVPVIQKLRQTIEAPFPPHFVFLVFVNRDNRGLVVFDWEKRKADPNHPGRPLGWESAFERIAWAKH
jgi:hypothetical protein